MVYIKKKKKNFKKLKLIEKVLVSQLYLTLFDPMDGRPTRLLRPWGFSRQEYWSGLPCPSPGDVPDPGIEPRSSALQAILYCLSYLGIHTT